jgi:Fe-S-cluster containining protein
MTSEEGDGRQRPAPIRTNDPRTLARAFEAKLAGTQGLKRALAAWALARATLEGTMAAQQVEAGACHKGCAWCCNFHVEVRLADAAHLARRAAAEPALEAKVRATAALVGHLDPLRRLRAAVPCAFLDNASGACRVYEDRPLACRAYRSRDAGWCRSLVGTERTRAAGRPVIQEGLAIRALVTEAMLAVTPPPWRTRGELHGMVVQVLDDIARRGAGANNSLSQAESASDQPGLRRQVTPR